ncbi:uncharacterized protein LOC128963512 [Oppia nitens]|uniref:uncharacterized protein LOC128963512 n=1 Tax=Oppia nitens TaxID=1686743 RepID=UPI0023DC5CBA|nr:uncharacterized protein LOC128963512 [Oppia nitens]
MKFSILFITLLAIWRTNAIPVESKEVAENSKEVVDDKDIDENLDVESLVEWDIPVDAINFDLISDRVLETDELNEKFFEEKNGTDVDDVIHIDEHDFREAPVEGPPLDQSEQPVLQSLPGVAEINLTQNLTGYAQFDTEDEAKEVEGANREIRIELSDLLSPEELDWSKPQVGAPEHHDEYQPSHVVQFPHEALIENIQLFPVEDVEKKTDETLTTNEVNTGNVVKH